MALTRSGHQQALGWAALVAPVPQVGLAPPRLQVLVGRVIAQR